MKYEVRDKVEIDVPAFFKPNRYKIQVVDTNRANPYMVKGSWWPEDSLKLIEKNLNGGTINTKDHSPDNGKYSPEQIAFLEEHAKAAMQGLMTSGIPLDPKYISETAYTFAEAMLQERERRVKG